MATQKSETNKGPNWHDADVAERYKNGERATREYAKILVSKSGLPESTSETCVLDIATGTGAVIQELYDAVPKEKWGNLKVLATDISESMLNYLRQRGESQGWTSLETQIVDGKDIQLPKETYTHVFVSFAIFALPGALAKLYEVLKPGGFLGVTTWTTLSWQAQLARSIDKMAGKPYNPTSTELESKMFGAEGEHWEDPKYVVSRLSEVGLKNVDVVTEKRTVPCGTPKSYIETLQFPMSLVTTFWDEEKRADQLKEVNALMLEEATKDAGGPEGQVPMACEANVCWGWKST